MIVLIEPISKNINMYVPAYPLPLLEVASFVKLRIHEADIRIISLPMDYGLPLTVEGKRRIHDECIRELAELKPEAVGISCTAISQAEGVMELCAAIKAFDPAIFIFLGGYFPTIYHEDIFNRSDDVDLIVVGEGERPLLTLAELLRKGDTPWGRDIPGCARKENGAVVRAQKTDPFDLSQKAPLNLELLKYPKAYDIIPYAFSRGCPYQCSFCMEESIRPIRREVPAEIVNKDLKQLFQQVNTRRVMVSDALFKSYNLFPLFRELGLKVNFETRSDVLNPDILPDIADVCGGLALGFESASYATLKRMNKVKDRSHYERYIANTEAIFKQAVKNEIPVMVFMIAGYPGDTERDLEESLLFARRLSRFEGPGGHVFKIGETRVYPRTKLYDQVMSMPDVEFDDDGVFGDNIVKKPSKDLGFETVLGYMKAVFELSNNTPKMLSSVLNVMPFFRLPGQALRNEIIPGTCFKNAGRDILSVEGESLAIIRKAAPELASKYKKMVSAERSKRNLVL